MRLVILIVLLSFGIFLLRYQGLQADNEYLIYTSLGHLDFYDFYDNGLTLIYFVVFCSIQFPHFMDLDQQQFMLLTHLWLKKKITIQHHVMSGLKCPLGKQFLYKVYCIEDQHIWKTE